MKLKRYSNNEIKHSLLAILPAMVLFLIFTYYPLVKNIIYSFTDYDGVSRNYKMLGLENFINVFKDQEVIASFFNTLYFTIVTVILSQIIPLILAVILFRNFKGAGIYKTIYYLPCVMSGVIVAYSFNSIFQYIGVINEFLKSIGLERYLYDWLGSTKTAMPVLIFINQWQFTGYSAVIFIAGLSSIPREIYEASDIDGAPGLKRFRYITFPCLMPSFTITLFLGITGCLKVFELPFVMTNGGPLNSTLTITMSLFNNMFSYQRFGYASSIGVILFIFIATVTIIQLQATRRAEVEY